VRFVIALTSNDDELRFKVLHTIAARL
jgi:hypothetical protein